MNKFSTLKSIPAYLPIVNIDTDMIIPKQFLKTIKRTGLGKNLFYEMRYDEKGKVVDDFILNKSPYDNSKILIAGNNFGCGSSREHAPWALLDFGITCVISTSYADIFYNNCFKNGILPIKVNDEQIKELSEYSKRQEEIAINLPDQKIIFGNKEIKFELDEFKKKCLIEGLDDIALSLEKSNKIISFEEKLNNGYLQSSSLIFYTASNPNTNGCVPITSSEAGVHSGGTGGGFSQSGEPHHSSSRLQPGIVIDRLEGMKYYVQGGALGEIGRFGCTSASKNNYQRKLIDEKPREFINSPNEVNLEGLSGEEAMNLDNFYSGSFHYEMSFLDKDHTLIIDVDKDQELFNGIGEQGLILIPEQLITDVRFNLEFYLNKAGILGSGDFNTTANINASYTDPD